jgi:hypothetical protein
MADKHPDKHQVRLGAGQETLFITLAAWARETQRKHPVLRDPRAVELLQSIDHDMAKYGRSAGGFITVLRTAIIDFWVREFLSAHPAGTVVELPFGYRYLVPLADPVVGKAMTLTLFRASSPAAGGPDATARAAGAA